MLDRQVESLKYVGPQRAARLKRLGIYTLEDLVWHFPRKYEDRRHLEPLARLVYGEKATVQVTIKSWEERVVRPQLKIFRALVEDGYGQGYALWFNQAYIKRQLPPGTQVFLTGRVGYRYRGLPVLQVEEYEVLERGDQGLHTGRLVPFYPLTSGLGQRWFRLIVHLALEEIKGQVPEILPSFLRERYGLLSRYEALRNIHFPSDEEALRQARRRLKYEELLLWELGLQLNRSLREQSQGIAHTPDNTLVQQMLAHLPFRLTEAQERVLGEILKDMESPRPMARLLQGDVGSGKTVVAAVAAVKAVAGGWQVALMAPTEVLAGQHGETLGRLLAPLHIPVVVLTGSTSKGERQVILSGLATGQLPVVVGTHALIQEGVKFKRLGLVIIDEQHRFGVGQRAALQDKGEVPDLLVMTATPIPRTLALALYGDLDISVIDQMPPGRQPVATYILSPKQREYAYRLIRRELAQGHQAYVICPLIEESETITAEAATAMADKLQREVFPEYRVGLIHGKLKPGEKEEVMQAFRRGDVHILVATTVIEVGIDVPNATVMMIEGAERLGLAQLHQLRGRVGRGTAPSHCLLVAGGGNEARKRLEVLANTQDGFAIAEADLRFRGPGEFYGTRQHGLPEFRLAVFPDDIRILERAREDAQKLCSEKFWKSREFEPLYRAVLDRLERLESS